MVETSTPPKQDFADFVKPQTFDNFFLPPGLEIDGLLNDEGDDDSLGSSTTVGESNLDVDSTPSSGNDLRDPAYVSISPTLGYTLQDNFAMNDYTDFQKSYAMGFPDFTMMLSEYMNMTTLAGGDLSQDYMPSLVDGDLTNDYMSSLMSCDAGIGNWRMPFDKVMMGDPFDFADKRQFVD
jgi:hypothetical protein